MNAVLPWIALGVSLFGLFFATLAPSVWLPVGAAKTDPSDAERADTRVTRQVLGVGSVLALVLFAMTLPGMPPWSTGQGLGRGFLLGAGSGLGAVAFLWHLRGRLRNAPAGSDSVTRVLVALCMATGLLSLAVLPLALVLVLLPASVTASCLGVAVGAVVIGILARFVYDLQHEVSAAVPSGATLAAWAIYTSTVACALVFGFYHFSAAQVVARHTPLGIAAITVLGATAATGLSTGLHSPARTFWIFAVLTASVVGGLGFAALPRLVPEPYSVVTLVGGIGTALLVGFVCATAAPRGILPKEAAALVAMMVLGLFLMSFRWLRGYGVGVALLGAWSAGATAMAILCWRDLQETLFERPSGGIDQQEQRFRRVALVMVQMLGTGLLALLFRLFLETRWDPLADLRLTIHFSFLGLLIGALVPPVAAAKTARTMTCLPVDKGQIPEQVTRHALRAGTIATIATGFWAVAVPFAVGVVWGMRALVGLVAGLVVAVTLSLLQTEETEKGLGLAWGVSLLVGVLMVLVVVQGSHLLYPFSELHRRVRAMLFLAVAIPATVSLIVGALTAQHAGERGQPVKVAKEEA